MIKPAEIIYIGQNLSLNYEPDPRVGDRGFTCTKWKKLGRYFDHECFLTLSAIHVDYNAPVKNHIKCDIRLSVHPTKTNGEYNVDGCSYHCYYSQSLFGNYTPSDFEKLLNKLFGIMCMYFNNNEDPYDVAYDDKKLTLISFNELGIDDVHL